MNSQVWHSTLFGDKPWTIVVPTSPWLGMITQRWDHIRVLFFIWAEQSRSPDHLIRSNQTSQLQAFQGSSCIFSTAHPATTTSPPSASRVFKSQIIMIIGSTNISVEAQKQQGTFFPLKHQMLYSASVLSPKLFSKKPMSIHQQPGCGPSEWE